jgi:hypothetical protein
MKAERSAISAPRNSLPITNISINGIVPILLFRGINGACKLGRIKNKSMFKVNLNFLQHASYNDWITNPIAYL